MLPRTKKRNIIELNHNLEKYIIHKKVRSQSGVLIITLVMNLINLVVLLIVICVLMKESPMVLL